MSANLRNLARERETEARRAQTARRASLDLREDEKKLYSLSAAIGCLLDRKVAAGSFEAEVSEALTRVQQKQMGNSLLVPMWALKRDLSVAGAGAYLVESETDVDGIAEILRGLSVVATLPITSLPNCTGNILIPREATTPTAYVLPTEATAITPSSGTFGQVALTPKNVAAMTNLSRQFSLQTGSGGARYVQSTLLKTVAAKVDALAINGSGTDGEPLGLISQATGSVSGTSLDEADIREFQTDVGVNLGPDCGWVTTSTIASLLNGRQRFTGSDRTLWEGNLYSGSIAGWPAYSSPSVPADHLLFGAWQQFVLASWGEALELAVNPYQAFTTGGIAVRVIASFDVGLMKPEAFSIATAVT